MLEKKLNFILGFFRNFRLRCCTRTRLTSSILRKIRSLPKKNVQGQYILNVPHYFFLSITLAVTFPTTVFTTTPFLLTIMRKCRTFSSKAPSMSWRSTCFFVNTVDCSDNLSLSWYFFLGLLAVLSPNTRRGWNFLTFFTAAIRSWMAAYFPITYLSLSVNLHFFRFLLLFWMAVATAVWSSIPRSDSCVGT